MKGRLGDKVRLQHILDAISEVEMYLESVTYEQFLQNSEKRFATIKQIEIVGEACNALSDDLKEQYLQPRGNRSSDLETSPFMNILASTCSWSGKLLKMTWQY